MFTLVTLFWVSCFLFLVPFVFYPLALYLLSRWKRHQSAACAEWPTVTLVISAFNEAKVIRSKLENACSLEYPKEKLEILLISDASDDGTDEIAREFESRGVTLCRQSQRKGKSAALTAFCPEARGAILVFTDANAIFRPDAITKLVRHFGDAKVGYVVGRQLYNAQPDVAATESENLYWNIELKLKQWESDLSSVVGADGAIYALRKELFEPLAAEDINDFLLPLKVVVKGYRGVFDPEAICFEDAAASFKGEFRRKYRIVNRSLRAVTKVPMACNPMRVGWFAFQLVCHKVLRWFGPLFLITMFVASGFAALTEYQSSGLAGLYSLIFGLQITGYLLAAAYCIPLMRKFRLVYIAYYAVMLNIAAAVGIGLLLFGKTIGTWKPQR